MTTKNLAQRLARIEAQRRPAARVVVCWCALPDGEHYPDCPAAGADGNDHVIWVTWQDGGSNDD